MLKVVVSGGATGGLEMGGLVPKVVSKVDLPIRPNLRRKVRGGGYVVE